MIRTPSRFDCPSSPLSLSTLLRQHRNMLWTGLALAVFGHLVLTQVQGSGQEQKVVKPLTTQFVKRAPRLTKPLEMKKQPRPKRRQIQRKMVSVQAKVNRRDLSSGVQPLQVVHSLAKPYIQMGRSAAFESVELEPQALAEQIMGSKESQTVVDMSLEMVDIDALDTGQYQAMVIQDANDKRNVRGFFHMVFAYSVTMYNNDWHSMFARRRIALMDLIEAVNRYTDIRADMMGTVTFDQEELLSVPWVFAGSHFNFRLTESEAQNLGRYLIIGGFLFADAGWRNNAQMDKGLRLMIDDALESQGLQKGKAWNMEKLPSSHPIYHCYFDFPGGPPIAGDWGAATATGTGGKPGGPFDYLEGVIIDGRLLAIMSLKWFAQGWSNAEMRQYNQDPVRAQQFGVNVIVFALTQEGSITNRLMDSVNR